MNLNSFQLGNSEKISALLDGELMQEEVGDLFLDLHNDPSLREELFDDIQLRNLAPKTLTQPPVAVKEDILSAIAVNATTGTPVLLENSLLAGIISSVMIIAGIWAGSNYQNNDFAIFESSNVGSGILSQSDEVIDFVLMDIPPEPDKVTILNDNASANEANYPKASSSNGYSSSNNLPSNLSRSLYGTDAEQKQESASLNTDKGSETIFETSPTSTKPFPQKISMADLGGTKVIYGGESALLTKSSAFEKFTPISTTDFDLTGSIDLPIMFTIRGFSAAQNVDVDVNRGSIPAINNFAIGALYKVDDNWSLGLEIGQEDYNQRFEGIDKNDRVFYQQVLTALWGGASLRYDSGKIIGDNISMYSQAFVGGTQVGAIGRVGTGLGFKISDKMDMNLGVELNNLFYRHQENNFNTTKYGVMYGFTYTP